VSVDESGDSKDCDDDELPCVIGGESEGIIIKTIFPKLQG